MSLNDGPCMVWPTISDLNPVDVPFMISLDKCSGSCNVLSSKKYVFRKKQKTHVKVFNMTTNKNKVKTMKKHI